MYEYKGGGLPGSFIVPNMERGNGNWEELGRNDEGPDKIAPRNAIAASKVPRLAIALHESRGVVEEPH